MPGMTEPLTLWNYCEHGRAGNCFLCANPSPPFVHTSQTSADAAFSIKPQGGRARILDFLRSDKGSWTDEGISLMLKMNPSTERPRRIELTNAGLIEAAGTAKTSSGRDAVLWRATKADS
jgi:hypothetical protein